MAIGEFVRAWHGGDEAMRVAIAALRRENLWPGW
jgi:hypothetical protein